VELTDRDQQATRVLRFTLAPIVAVVGWFVVLFLGLAAVGVLDSFCPPEEMVSGSCQADWYGPAVDALIVAFSGLSAVVVVLAPTLMAPSRKIAVAAVAFGCGAAVALSMWASEPELLAEFLAAFGCGAATLALVVRKLRASSPSA